MDNVLKKEQRAFVRECLLMVGLVVVHCIVHYHFVAPAFLLMAVVEAVTIIIPDSALLTASGEGLGRLLFLLYIVVQWLWVLGVVAAAHRAVFYRRYLLLGVMIVCAAVALVLSSPVVTEAVSDPTWRTYLSMLAWGEIMSGLVSIVLSMNTAAGNFHEWVKAAPEHRVEVSEC